MRMVCGYSSVLPVMASLVATTVATVYPSPGPQEKEVSYWHHLMQQEIQEALDRPRNFGMAKNVLIFMGDGMGITVQTAGRILKGQKQGVSGEEGHLVWERFPNIGLLKTYNLDTQVPDSASTGNAYLSGVKVNHWTIGVTGKVVRNDCAASLLPENRLDSILKWAQDAGKDTGVVTTTQVTHATPAALYAKVANRRWQCDTALAKAGATACKDIARQLVQEEPGRNMKVVMGGGRQELGVPLEEAELKCPRSDGRDLVQEWKEDKEVRGATYSYVTNTRQLREVDTEATDYLMGLFAERHTPYEVDRDQGPDGTPSLKDMTQAALNVLKKGPKGFFLLVEGGKIDKGLHVTKPRRALEEVVSLDEAVEAALKMVDLEETLVLVTADHSHSMTMAGYPPRGNDILGVVTNEHVTDDLPYTTLMFAIGQGYNYTWDGEKVLRRNLTGVDTTAKDFEALAAVPTVDDAGTHGGEDVAVFATGPMSHLFHRVHEQTFVAHVMAYAACIGPYRNNCSRQLQKNPEDSYTLLDNIPKDIDSPSSEEVHEDPEEGESHPEMAPEGSYTVPEEVVAEAEKEPQEIPVEVHIELKKDYEDPEEGESHPEVAPEGPYTVPEEVAAEAEKEPQEIPVEIHIELKKHDDDDDDDDDDDSKEDEGTNIESEEDGEDIEGDPIVNPANAYVHVKNLLKSPPRGGTAANSASCVTVLSLVLFLCL